METWKIERINTLARKGRSGELTDEEKEEQTLLRNEYRRAVIGNLRHNLDSIEIVDET